MDDLDELLGGLCTRIIPGRRGVDDVIAPSRPLMCCTRSSLIIIARQQGCSKAETARMSFRAGLGHVLSTLAIAAIVWLAGVAVASRFGHWVDTLANIALVAFGGWIAVSAWRDLHGHGGHAHHHGHRQHYLYPVVVLIPSMR